MFTVMYYKDGQYWGSSTHNSRPQAEAAILAFHQNNPGDGFSAFIK